MAEEKNDYEREEELEDENLEDDEEDSDEDDEDSEDLPEEYANLSDHEARVRAYKSEKAIEANKRKEKRKKKSPKKEKKITSKTDEDVDVHELSSTVSDLALAEKKRRFQHETGLSPEAVDHVFKLKENPSKKDLEDDFIKGGVDAIERKTKQSKNTPSSSGASRFAPKGKEWKELSKEEKQKAFEKYTQSR